LAFPSKKLIADTIGKDPTTVRRRLARLEKDGLIKRILRPQPGGRHNSNEYKLAGLITGAEPLALEELQKREESRVYRKARATKKGVAPGAVKS
jgi:DNA-binding HxlR family transcriptional regulator